MIASETIVELKSHIKYAHPQSGEHTATFITLFAPRISHISLVAPLKQHFMKASSELAISRRATGNLPPVDTGSSTPVEITDDDIVQMLEVTSVEMSVVLEQFKKIVMTPALCKLEGEITFTEYLYNQIGVDDFYQLLGRYLRHFIVASLIK